LPKKDVTSPLFIKRRAPFFPLPFRRTDPVRACLRKSEYKSPFRFSRQFFSVNSALVSRLQYVRVPEIDFGRFFSASRFPPSLTWSCVTTPDPVSRRQFPCVCWAEMPSPFLRLNGRPTCTGFIRERRILFQPILLEERVLHPPFLFQADRPCSPRTSSWFQQKTLPPLLVPWLPASPSFLYIASSHISFLEGIFLASRPGAFSDGSLRAPRSCCDTPLCSALSA